MSIAWCGCGLMSDTIALVRNSRGERWTLGLVESSQRLRDGYDAVLEYVRRCGYQVLDDDWEVPASVSVFGWDFPTVYPCISPEGEFVVIEPDVFESSTWHGNKSYRPRLNCRSNYFGALESGATWVQYHPELCQKYGIKSFSPLLVTGVLRGEEVDEVDVDFISPEGDYKTCLNHRYDMSECAYSDIFG